MAEILGTVASGLQMAGLAAKTITIGFSVRTLYLEMQGASTTIANSLGDIQAIAQILEELGKSPMAAYAWLRTARSHCEKCLQELRATLHTLDNKIRSSRGFSSKIICLNFILRKGDIAKMERRLETSLRLLLFAVQLAVLASHERLEQLVESQNSSSRTSYALFATQSCIDLGEPYSSTTSQLNQMFLLPGVTDQGDFEVIPNLSSIAQEQSPRTGGEVIHGFARRSARSRHHFVRRTLQTQ